MRSLSLPSITAAVPCADDDDGSRTGRDGDYGIEARQAQVSNIDPAIASPTHQKRQSTWDSDRGIKRRSTKACLSCRSRKVRCDVIVGGSPCTNCRLDDLQCIVKEPRRGRRPGSTAAATAAARAAAAAKAANSAIAPPTQGATNSIIAVASTSNPSRASNCASTTSASSHNASVASGAPTEAARGTSSPLQAALSPTSQRPMSPSRPTGADDLLVTLTFEDQESNNAQPSDNGGVFAPNQHSPRSPHDMNSINGGSIDTPEMAGSVLTTRSAGSILSEQSARSIHSPHGTPSTTAGAAGGSRHMLPSYIRPLPSHIGPRDMDYLADKGALTIVDDDFRDELLRIYANHVFTFMPAIDLDAFIGAIARGPDSTRPPVSLLLFQAVMFVSVTFADQRLLQEHGFRSPKEARKVFFGRVRLLYGMDCETDRRSLLSSVLLMTFWYDTPEDGKDTWYWMGIALTIAQVDGLHRNPHPNLKMSRAEKQLRRRQWWSCLIRDRLIALGIRRPTRIRDVEFDVPPLSLDDFDVATDPLRHLNKNDDAGVEPTSNANATLAAASGSRKALAVMAIELGRLCICIGHILASQYTVMGDHPVGSEYLLKAFVVPKRSDDQNREMVRCDAELQEWLQNQDSGSRYVSGSLLPDSANYQADRVVRLQQALLHLIYLTSQTVLHRPQAVRPNVEATGKEGTPSVDQLQQRRLSRERVTNAATGITKIVFDLQCSKQLRYMSTSSVPAFLSASLIHLMDIRSSNEEVRNVSIGRFYQCVQALQELQDTFASAVYGLRFIFTVLQNTDIRIPMFQAMLRPLMGSIRAVNGASTTPSFAPSIAGNSQQYLQRHASPASSTIAEGTFMRRYEPAFDSSFGSIGCTYPSFGTNTSSAVDGTRRTDSVGELGLSQAQHNQQQQQQQSMFLGSYSHWEATNAQLSGMVQQPDLLEASPYLNNWADIDGLVPSMMSFEPDPNSLMGGMIELL